MFFTLLLFFPLWFLIDPVLQTRSAVLNHLYMLGLLLGSSRLVALLAV